MAAYAAWLLSLRTLKIASDSGTRWLPSTTVLIYGLLAFIIALPLGALAAFGLSQWFLNAFNIDHDNFSLLL